MDRLTRAEEKLLFGLHRRAVREDRGLFLAEGIRVVEELLDSDLQLELAVTTPAIGRSERGRAIAQRLEGRCPVRLATDAEIERVSATDTPQSVVVAAHIPTMNPATFRPGQSSVVLVLDAIQDPGNFGTLVRCADAFAIDMVMALSGTVDPWNPKCVRAAAGTAFRVPIAQVDAAMGLGWLDTEHYEIWAADANGEPAGALDPPSRVALVAGNEGAGVSAALLERARHRVAVPIRGNAESLNVAVATGILLYMLTREG